MCLESNLRLCLLRKEVRGHERQSQRSRIQIMALLAGFVGIGIMGLAMVSLDDL